MSVVASFSAARKRLRGISDPPKAAPTSKPEGVYVVVGDLSGPHKQLRIKKQPKAEVVKQTPKPPSRRKIPTATPVALKKAVPSRIADTQPQVKVKPTTTRPKNPPTKRNLPKKRLVTNVPRPLKPKQGFLVNWGGFFGLCLAAIVLTIGWQGRDTRGLFADEGLGYALGIVGSLLILTLLLFPLRKRFRILKVLGPVKNWFKTHMILGVVGPIAILYHSNFQLGSLNSTVALVSMLLVSSSGLVGRFFYTKIHHGLYGRKKRLKDLLAQVKLSGDGAGVAAKFVPDLMQKISDFDRQVLVPPKSIWASMVLPLRLTILTRLAYFRLTHHVRRALAAQAKHSSVVAQHRRRMNKASRRYVAEHLRRVRRVAEFSAYDRLFALWHKVHLPFFFLLLITAIIHVIAVHWYSR